VSFYDRSGSWFWILDHSIGWVVLFIFTQLLIESYEKYSPGVFWDILIGRYIRPKVQKRIILFLDLKDSTPIAEKLDSTIYFSFIRDFIYYISIALLEYDGRIYQYVGDEIVASWLSKTKNVEKCVNALILSERLIRKNRKYFLKRYGMVPEFKAGIHVGEVTVGEIGIIKKDLAISGDTMNTAARIRTACKELNHKCLASKEFIDETAGAYPTEPLGAIDLKGKTDSVELFALKI
jgi:adenylate cyclase